MGLFRGGRRARLTLAGVGLALVAGTIPAGGATADHDPGGPAWAPLGGAVVQALRGEPAPLTSVSSAGSAGSGIVAGASGAGQQFARATVQGTPSSVGSRVRLRIQGPDGLAASSAPVTLQPWPQTVGVSAAGDGPFRLALLEEGASWRAGDTYLVSESSVTAQGPTVTSTSGRQLLVNGQPYTMKGYVYFPTPPGDLPWVRHWNSVPQQCQSDAQLMRAAGVNTLRIWYLETSYDETSYRQCADAFHAAGIMLMWLVQPPGGLQTHLGRSVDVDGSVVSLPEGTDLAYMEVFWQHLAIAIERLKDHPATLGWNIANEMSFRAADGNGWLEQADELAKRAKELDPLHVTTTALSLGQFFRDVRPDRAPSIDLWGVNRYGWPADWADQTIARDPTRPVWISEFGRPRYTCWLSPDAFGTQLVFDQLGCSMPRGSGEDVPKQRNHLNTAWSAISANLSANNPGGAVVGGTLFMWADLWWFACCAVTGTGTPSTRDVGSPPNLGDDYRQSSHLPVEWYGTTLAMAADAPGPRITTPNYDFMAQRYTGASPVTVSGVEVSTAPCAAEVSWTTSQPAFGHADFGLENKVTNGFDVVLSESFVGERSVQDDTLRTAHTAVLDDLLPGQAYLVYLRGFDTDGRSGTSGAIPFTTPDDVCV